MTKIFPLVLSISATLLGACSGDGSDGVTDLPDGTATGTAASGTYAVTLRVTACSGTCTPGLCQVGQRVSADAVVVQRDGHLTLDAGGVPLAGGIDADGTYLIGGQGTLGTVTAAITSDGQWQTDRLLGAYDMHVTGTDDGASVDCAIASDLSGVRAR